MSATESQTTSGGIGQKAKEAAQAAADTIKSRAAETSTRVKDTATEMVHEHREQAADRIGSMGSALDESARSVEQEDPNIAWLTRQASSRLQDAAEYVRTCSWQRLRDDSADFARRHPVAFFGGMLALGALAGAVIKAGAQAGLDSAQRSAADDMDHVVPPESDSVVSPGTEEPYATPTATI